MVNCAVIMGRLTADPELRTTTSGISTTRFTVAVDRSYTKPGEERKADFISVVAWRQTADFVTKYFSKGSMIAIQGSIQTGSYDDKNGVKHYTTDVIADKVSFCGSKNDNAAGVSARIADPAAQSFTNGSADDFEALADDDDLPF